MRRVVVLGNPGSGKSVLAARIAAAHGLRLVEADVLRWGPGWSKLPETQYTAALAALTDGDGWVAEGIYGEVVRLASRADVVVWLDLPLRTLLWRVTRRSVLRSWRGEQVCGGNRERFRNLIGPNSMPLYTLRIHRHNRRQISRATWAGHTPARLLRFTTSAQVNAWLPEVAAPGGPRGCC